MLNNHKILLTLFASKSWNLAYTTRQIKRLVILDNRISSDYHEGANKEGYVKRFGSESYIHDFCDYDRISRGLRALGNKGYLKDVSQSRVRRWKITEEGLNKARLILGDSSLALTDEREYVRAAALKLLNHQDYNEAQEG